MIAWADGVRQKVLRESTWTTPLGVIADETRCGRKKTRPALSLQPTKFNVSMQLPYSEYVIFKNWFRTSLRMGALSFGFPEIDVVNGDIVEYRFVAGTEPQYSNPSGNIVKVTMEWEEV